MIIALRIVLQDPPANLTYALQKGSGNSYSVEQLQRSAGEDLCFDVMLGIKTNDGMPDFKCPYVQGPKNGRFIYLNFGKYAGEEAPSGGRIKVPLTGITADQVLELQTEGSFLITRLEGADRQGKPTCATPKNFAGWSADHR